MSHYLLVGNPTAQSGQNSQRIERAKTLIEQTPNARCELFSTLPGGKTIAALSDRLAQANMPDVVIAMGGDGTFREVAAALVDSPVREQIVMAMLPTGTANDQGKSFGLSAGDAALERNVAVLTGTHETRLDGGEMLCEQAGTSHRHLFFDSAGWGFSARVLLERNLDREFVEKLGALKHLYRDHLVYAGAFSRVFLDSFMKDQTFDVKVQTDTETVHWTGLTDLIVKNTRIYAGAWVLDKSASPNDGLFEVVPFRNQLDWALKVVVDHQGNILPEDLKDPGRRIASDMVAAREMVLTFTDRMLPLAQIDGEEANPSPRVTIRVLPKVLRLRVPEAFA
jgi:diacylglycerol kinase family enzyme